MSELPKLNKNLDLLAPKKDRKIGRLAKVALLSGSTLAGAGFMNAAPAPATVDTSSPAVNVASPSNAQPAPLILEGAASPTALGQHSSHASHASHRSHSSHQSSAF